MVVMTIGLILSAYYSGSNLDHCSKGNTKGAMWASIMALVIGLGMFMLAGEFL